jgi:hypothetical protein
MDCWRPDSRDVVDFDRALEAGQCRGDHAGTQKPMADTEVPVADCASGALRFVPEARVERGASSSAPGGNPARESGTRVPGHCAAICRQVSCFSSVQKLRSSAMTFGVTGASSK